MQIFIIIAAVILAVVIQLVLQHRQADRLTASVYPDADEAEPDEKLHVVIRIKNPSWVICPFVRFGVMIPNTMTVHSDINTVSHPPASVACVGTCVLWPHRTFEKRIEVSAPVRGNYRFGNFYIEVGDFLGLKEYRKNIIQFASVAVYPRPLDDAVLDETPGSIIGDISVRRFIYEDPVLISGFREYTGREPMKSISWIQSVRTGKLMVSKYDHTSDISVSVLLDSQCRGEFLEPCFSLARSVCDHLENKGIEYDFFMNARIGGNNCMQHYFARGMGERHYRGILRQLANALETCDLSGEELIGRLLDSGRPAQGIIIVCAERNEARDMMIRNLAENPAVNVNVIYAEEHVNDEDNSADEDKEAV